MPANSGKLVIIVGPSGSGKDTLIGWLREALSARDDVMFVRRVVTRKSDANSEDHGSLSVDEFARAEREGAFSVTWEAHELFYGLPMSVKDHVEAGGIAIANGSRRALDAIKDAFSELVIVNLTVDEETLATRLRARGRESEDDIKERLRLAKIPLPEQLPHTSVDNSSDIERAGNRVLSLVE